MANRFANGAKSFGFCDRCGFRFPLKKLKNEVVKTKQTQIKSCPQCWSEDHPQLLLGTFPVADPQAIRDPRPDTNTWYASGNTGLQTSPTSGTGPDQEGFPGEGSRVIQWGWAPVGGSQSFDDGLTPNWLTSPGEVGTVAIVAPPPGQVYINVVLIPPAILRAAAGLEPERTLFRTTLIGTRPLADINNSGTVTSADSLAYFRWYSGVVQPDPAYNTYITTVMNPYMITNSSTYSAYLIFT